MERFWAVLLEAAGEESGPPLEPECLRQLSEVLDCDEVVGFPDPHRYAVQLVVASASPAEALFAASARWADAQRRLGLTRFQLKRAEVLSSDEYERECAAAGARLADRRPASPEGDELLRRVFHDSLTGLPSLAFFRDRAQAAVSSGALTGPSMLLVVLDVDGFAAINDELGYAFGDEVMVTLARRLSSLADPGWALSRLAGDEFVLLVDDGPGGAESVARLILDTVREPIFVNRRPVVVTASLGLVPVGFDSDLDECLGRAGTAMCAAKEAGGDGFCWYELGLAADRRRLDFVGQHLPDRLAYIMLLERAALAANECASLEEAAAVVLHQVLAHTGWRAGRLWRVDDEGSGLVPTGVWYAGSDRPDSHLPVPVAGGGAPAAGAGLPGRVLSSGRPEWASAAGGHGSGRAPLAPGAAATVAFPVLAGREVVAVLEFFSARPIAPDDSLLEVMAAVGAQLGRNFERTRAAAALARSEERYRRLADSLPAFIWAAGADGRCTFVNRGWLEFTGRPMEAELGDGWAVGVHPEDLGASIRAYLPAFAHRRPFEIEFRMRRHDGQYRWLLSQGAPVFDNGVFGGFVGSCMDITDRRLAEAERSDRRLLVMIPAAELRTR